MKRVKKTAKLTRKFSSLQRLMRRQGFIIKETYRTCVNSDGTDYHIVGKFVKVTNTNR